jgi:hypothetical protein
VQYQVAQTRPEDCGKKSNVAVEKVEKIEMGDT